MMPQKQLVNVTNVTLRDLVFRKIWESGCACAPDLAGQIGGGKTADELIPILDSLVVSGLLRHKAKDPDDPRDYQGKYQVVYEPVI